MLDDLPEEPEDIYLEGADHSSVVHMNRRAHQRLVSGLRMSISAAAIIEAAPRSCRGAAGRHAGEGAPSSDFRPAGPRLIKSSAQPMGAVPVIIADVVERGEARHKIELAEAYKAYVSVCREQEKRPVPPEAFAIP